MFADKHMNTMNTNSVYTALRPGRRHDDPTIVGEETQLLSCLSNDNGDWQDNYTVTDPTIVGEGPCAPSPP